MAKVYPTAETENVAGTNQGVTGIVAANPPNSNLNIRKMLSTTEDSNNADMIKKMTRRKSLTASLTPSTTASSFDASQLNTTIGEDDSMILMLLNHLAGTLGELQQRDISAWKEFGVLTKSVFDRINVSHQMDNELLTLLKEYKYQPDTGWLVETVNIDRLYNQLSTLYLAEQSKADDDGETGIKIKNIESLSFCPNLLFSNFPSEFASKPCVSVFDGAVLLADISGFSKFAGEMCVRGAKGLDVLHKVTSSFLGHFVQTVYDFDGDGKLKMRLLPNVVNYHIRSDSFCWRCIGLCISGRRHFFSSYRFKPHTIPQRSLCPGLAVRIPTTYP
jgi:hypothetical protein